MNYNRTFDSLEEAQPILDEAVKAIGEIFAINFGVAIDGDHLSFIDKDNDNAVVGHAADLIDLQQGHWENQFAVNSLTAAFSVFIAHS